MLRGRTAWRRSGGPERREIPKLSDPERNKPSLFLEKLRAAVRSGPSVTSFFIQRSAYFVFFGKQLSIGIADANAMDEKTTSSVRSQPVRAEAISQSQFETEQRHEVRCLPTTEPMSTDDACQQSRLEDFRKLVEEQEARLEQLAQRERDQKKA